ncbi:hypothetical protein OEZ86_009487 [Tetradesmus obliquus]|uniref:Uncharacterized protein n=1 Tax=Tetradesmus obliquus TaxID=3088 RepID=A0ABY8UNC8_TETOB|nr:hypothetical protein OEZ85_000934 [Tetradesmus obliquus]WIA42944.1 hypothetical protein OEZ86_009487 [Tetradesmus obliquus]
MAMAKALAAVLLLGVVQSAVGASPLGKVDGAAAAVNETAGMSGIDAEFTANVVTVGPSTCPSGTSATLGVKTTNTNSSPDKWFSTQGVAAADVASYTAENKPKLNEATVFHSELTHSGLGTAWTMKIGRGGQIYSLSTPEFGELIPKQRVTIGQWMDEVFQHVLPMPPQKLGGISTSEIVDGDIHQAGMYVTSDVMHQPLLSHSVYSPLFAYQHNPCENKVDYITWPLHAHHPRHAAATTITVDRPVVKPTSGATPDYAKTCTVQKRTADPSPWETCTQSPCNVTYDPNNYRQNLVLMHQTISDLDNGVIKIDLEINKWGGSVHEGLQGPWAAFRTSTVPVMILSKADGTYEQVVTGAADPNCPYLSNGKVGNWVALMNENSPAGKGIGLVFGSASSLSPADAPDFLSWSSYGKDDLSGTVFNVGRKIYLVAGESLWLRYFLVLGDIAHIQARAKALRPCNIITKQKRNTDVIEKAGASLVCFDKTTFRPVRCRPSNTTLQPIFKAFRDYVSGAKPLFMLADRTRSRYVVTTNPYFVSYDPTDNKTAYLDFLGWALPSARATYFCSKMKDPNCAQDLTTAFGAMTSKPIINVASNLRVLTLTSKAVPSDSSAFTPAACIPL